VWSCSKADGAAPNYFLARARSNIGPNCGGWEYRHEERRLESNSQILSSRIVWGQARHGSVTRLAPVASVPGPEHMDKVDRAMDWLARCLGTGRLPAQDIEARAVGDGISKATLRRAKDALGVKSTKAGMNGRWEWELV